MFESYLKNMVLNCSDLLSWKLIAAANLSTEAQTFSEKSYHNIYRYMLQIVFSSRTYYITQMEETVSKYNFESYSGTVVQYWDNIIRKHHAC